MNQLNIINQNGQLLVDSREVAQMIGVKHSDLLEKIGGSKKVVGYVQHLENGKFRSQDFFIPSTYKVEGNNKTYECYLLTRKGCDMVANKLTGEKGVLFTAEYVTRFEEMQNEIRSPRVLKDPVELALETSLKNYQEIKAIKGDVDYLKENMRIDGAQEYALNSQGKAKIFEVLGGYQSPAYNAVSKKAFAELWRDFKRHFCLPRYSELPKTKFDDAVYFISKWRPSTSLEIEIESYNRQGHLI